MNCLYFYNNQSGKNKLEKKKDYIINRLKTKYDIIECYDSSSFDDMIKNFNANKHYDAIVFAGGDGTVNSMLNWTKNLSYTPTFGYIPSGTVNDFAKNLNLNKNVKKSVDVILNGQTKQIDCFKNGDRLGIYVCCTGIFTTASYDATRKAKKKFGKLAYYFHSIKELFTHRAYTIEITNDNKTQKLHSVLTLLINSKSVAGYKFNKNVDINDGEMEFLSINQKKDKFGFKSLMLIAKLFLFGINSVKKNKNVTYFKFKKLQVNFEKKRTINIDGENGGEGDINIEVLPNKVKFFSKEQ